MRELWRTLREEPHDIFDALSMFPRRHPLWIAGTIAGVAAFFLVVGTIEFSSLQSEVKVLRPQITNIQRGDPCVQLSQANGSNRARVHRLTKRCVGFLNGIAPLVSTTLACAIIEKGGYRCLALPANSKPTPSSSKSGSSEGVVPSTGNSPHSQPGPPSHGGPHGGHGHSGHSAPPSSPTPAPEPSPPASESAAPLPGNSGSTPAAENAKGLGACVEVVVSACVKAEAELPLHP
jgi:hypothetical protein